MRCARWPFSAEDAEVIRELVSAGIDWKRFLALCRHHRLAPLVHRALTKSGVEVPATTLAELKSSATSNAMSTLGYLAETARLCDLLQQAGVPVRVLKGVPLSQRAFADPSLRDVGDIDLLIATGMEETADRVLMADGFRRSDPEAPLTPRRRRSWSRHGKDYTYLPDRDGFEIDLHWRLFRNPHMPGNALADPAANSGESMQLGATALAVLPAERSFLYLCVHGALDGWFRFKSLADVAALWRSFGEGQRDLITGVAREHGILPELAAALALGQRLELLGAHGLTPSMHLQADCREARWILRYAQRQHLEQDFLPTPNAVGSWSTKRYELGLRRSFVYRFEVLRRVLLRPRVWARFDLPDTLFPLYALLSPLEWLLFHRPVARAGVAFTRRSRWGRWRSLSGQRRRLLAEAFVMLCLARAALVFLPMRQVFRWLEQPSQDGGTSVSSATDTSRTTESIRWAVLTTARYGPFSFVCFPQALAAHAMLRRRGVRSVMHYGVRRAADRTLRAHTWLEVDHHMLLGGETAMLFAPIHSTDARSGKPT